MYNSLKFYVKKKEVADLTYLKNLIYNVKVNFDRKPKISDKIPMSHEETNSYHEEILVGLHHVCDKSVYFHGVSFTFFDLDNHDNADYGRAYHKG